MEKDISLKKLLGNSMWTIVQKVLTMILTVVVTGIIARYLGTENYGTVNYVISVVAIFTTFSTLGMETITVKDLVDKKQEEGDVLGTSFSLRIMGGIVLILISQITLYILEGAKQEIQILGLLYGIVMLLKAFEVIEYYIQANMKLKIAAIIRFIATIGLLGYKVLVVVFNWGNIGYISSYIIDAFIAGLLFYIWYKSTMKIKWKFNKEYAKSVLRRGWYFILAGLISTLYMRMDQVMLGSMLEDKTQNGIYSAAVKIAEMWYFVPLAVISSFQPVIIKLKSTNEKQYLYKMQKLYDIVAIIGIACGIGVTIFGKYIVNILYGQEYMEATKILLISIWAGLFATLGSARGVWIISENLQKYIPLYLGMGCLTNLILNAVLIPKAGAYGAAIATLISQIVSSIIAVLFIKKTRVTAIMMLKSIFKNGVLIVTLEKIRNRRR